MTDKQNDPIFNIEKIYVKDVSFESHNPLPYFSGDRVDPEINLQLQSDVKKAGDNFYEVTLELTITARPRGDEKSETTIYLVEIKQAGLFKIANIPEDRMQHLVASLCPGILFPYAREAVSNLVERGGFPQLLLAPLNFDALYQEHVNRQKAQADDAQAQAEPKDS